MEQAAEILVIINSVVLFIFIILSIIAVVQFMSLLKHIRALVGKAEDVADTVESAVDGARIAFTKVAVGRLVTKLAKNMAGSSTKRSK